MEETELTHQINFITFEESNFSKATIRTYRHRINKFYENSPIKSDSELLDCKTDDLQNILLSYVRFLLSRVKTGQMHPNTFPKMFRGIKWLLNANGRENEIKWKSLEVLFPKEVKRSGYKAWTTEQLHLILEHTREIRSKALIHFNASTGCRIGVHDHPLLIKHLIPMHWNQNKCYAVLLYAERYETVEEKDLRDSQDDVQSGDSYWAFLTPEATLYLDRYFDDRKKHGDQLHPDSPIFRLHFSHETAHEPRQLSDSGSAMIMRQSIEASNVNRIKIGNRYDIQTNHGLRKRFNTILKLEENLNSNIAEKILGHKNGLDGVYLAPTRQQCFDEFVKGITSLTVSDSLRTSLKLSQSESKNAELQKIATENESLKNRIDAIEYDFRKSNDVKNTLIESILSDPMMKKQLIHELLNSENFVQSAKKQTVKNRHIG